MLKYIHGESTPLWYIFLIHLTGIGFGLFLLLWVIPTGYFAVEQSVLYVLLSWDLVGGVLAVSNPLAKKFWASRPKGEHEVYVLIHLVQPIIWYLLFGMELMTAFYILGLGMCAGYCLVFLNKRINRLVAPLFLVINVFVGWKVGGYPEYLLPLVLAYSAKLPLFGLK